MKKVYCVTGIVIVAVVLLMAGAVYRFTNKSNADINKYDLDSSFSDNVDRDKAYNEYLDKIGVKAE